MARRGAPAGPLLRRLPRPLRRSRAAELRLGAAARERHPPPTRVRPRRSGTRVARRARATARVRDDGDRLQPTRALPPLARRPRRSQCARHRRPERRAGRARSAAAARAGGAVRPPSARAAAQRGGCLARRLGDDPRRARARACRLCSCPQAADQFDNAARAEAAGAAVVLRPGEVTAESVRAALGRVLGEPAFTEAARKIQREIQEMATVDEAATAVEEHVARG